MKRLIPTLILFLHSLLAGPLCAAGPELSADEPINFSAETGMLIATGNAVFTDANTRVEADEIRYHRERGIIEAIGNVRVTRVGVRLLAQNLRYNTHDRSFSAGPFRAGTPPVFIAGDGFAGTLDALEMQLARVWFGEPVADSPSLQFTSGRWVANERIEVNGVRLRAFENVPLIGSIALPLPSLTYQFGQPSLSFDARGGYSDRLGAFVDTSFLLPTRETLSLGANVGIFSNRGLLIGPRLQWQPNDSLTLDISSGWIRDHNDSERGSDLTGSAIGRDRGFLEWTLRGRHDNDRLQFLSHGMVLSDSDMLRDFRSGAYGRILQPDSFADFTFQNGPFLLNLFTRVQLNDYYTMVEKLPELRAEWLPDELGRTGVFLQGFVVATRYRMQELTPALAFYPRLPNPLGLPQLPIASGSLPAALEASRFYNRLEGGFTLFKPIALPHGIDFSVQAGSRWSHYQASAQPQTASVSASRLVGEVGADLSQTLARTFHFTHTNGSDWRLRHLSRPFLQYRWHPGAEKNADIIPPFERMAYSPFAPQINLADISHPDGMRDGSVGRIGWEHRFETATQGGPWRDWLRLSLTQDYRFDTRANESAWDGLYFEADFSPFSWLRLQYLHKVRTADGITEATWLRAAIASSNLWDLALVAEYLEGAFEQYELQAMYRFSQNWGVTGRWRYDATVHRLNRHEYGWFRRIGNIWQLDLYVAFSEDDRREASFGAGVRLSLLRF